MVSLVVEDLGVDDALGACRRKAAQKKRVAEAVESAKMVARLPIGWRGRATMAGALVQSQYMWGADTIKVIRVPMSGIDRAIAERREEGMVKLVVHKNGSILGVSILAPNAGEIILTWVLAISTGQKIGKMAGIIAPYPTFGDASKQAAGKFFTEKLFSDRTRRIVRFLIRI